MSLKHAILGFLSFQSFSGYDLKKAFDNSVQHFWPANQSQIYRTLAALKEEGFVEQEVIEREDRLDKKLYNITPSGREELHTWLSTPLPPVDTREPFLIQLYFGGKLTDEEVLSILKHEITYYEETLQVFGTHYIMYKEMLKTTKEPRAFFLSVLTLESGITNGIATLEFLRSAHTRIQSGEYTFTDFQLENIIHRSE